MITTNIKDLSSMSTIMAKVSIWDGDTFVRNCTCGDILESFTVTREGDTSKFFGFGICQRLDINLINFVTDENPEEVELNIGNTIQIGLGNDLQSLNAWDVPYPIFHIVEINNDEVSETIKATAYDKLYKAASHTFDELGMTAPYTLKYIAEDIATLLGVTLAIDADVLPLFDLSYPEGANLYGTEDLRTILNAIAEATQTIYYLDRNERLVFKRLDKDALAVLTITKDDYYDLNTQTPRTLTGICNATELGENLEANSGEEGVTQYIRNNPFLELRADVADVLNNAIAALNGFTITQFNCDWTGNHLLEIGDKIEIITEDNSPVYSYVLCDVIYYAGTLSEITEWEYTDQESETASNPTNIGEKINQTFAKVDKVAREITLVSGKADETREQVGQLQIKTDSVEASVKTIETIANDKVDSLAEDIETLTNEVNLKLSAEDVTIAITNTLNNGVDKVVTSTKKYTFDDTGLSIGSSDGEINTVVSEDGMRINRAGQEVLSADNSGVKAEDLHATTYLIIGDKSRLETWSDSTGTYTACFWIGG